MHTITTNRTMKSVKIIACLILIAIAASGCETRLKIPEYTGPEPVCDKENDRYFDFIDTQTCIKPVTYEQLYILDKYKFFSELAAETPDDVIKIRVGFSDYLTPDTYNQLIVEEQRIQQITAIDLFYPDLDKHGLAGNYQPRTNETVERNEMLQTANNYNVAIFSDLYYDPNENTQPLYSQEDMVSYGVAIVEITMKAADIPKWWKEKKGKVRYIQPLITDIDPAQTPYYPNIPIVPRGLDPVIDWDSQ